MLRGKATIGLAVKAVTWRSRLLSSSLRALPDFIVIGAQRAGTTSLFEHLAAHPQVIRPYRKEVHYFDLHATRGVGWYRANFPLRSSIGRQLVTGEATPNYLAHPDVPRQVHEVTPDVLLIALLRDPVERTHSSWRHGVRRGYESRPFEDALAEEIDYRTIPTCEPTSNGSDPMNTALRRGYLAKSRYAEHLERWLALFPRERVLVIESERLFTDPAASLERICGYLGISDWESDLPWENAVPHTAMSDDTRKWLAEYFAPHNARLEALLDQQFSWANG